MTHVMAVDPHLVATTAAVLTMHGSARHADRRRFAYRNIFDAAALDRALQSMKPCVSLTDALDGRGVALTIDDATRGAADAALQARRHGHEVTLFVNPAQVESGEPYAFLVLNLVLDRVDLDACEFEDERYPLRTIAEKSSLRARIKAHLATIGNEHQRLAYVRALATQWRVHDIVIAPHFRTLSRRDLTHLRDAGVSLQNHGWEHSSHAFLSPSESAREITLGRVWLERELRTDARWFAVPYGNDLPHQGVSLDCDAWLSVTSTVPPGWVRAGVYNREELPEPRSRPTLVSRLLARLPHRKR